MAFLEISSISSYRQRLHRFSGSRDSSQPPWTSHWDPIIWLFVTFIVQSSNIYSASLGGGNLGSAGRDILQKICSLDKNENEK